MRRKMLIQRLFGIALLGLSVLWFWWASHGITVEERDCTITLISIPLGLYLLFSRNLILDI